MHTKKTMKQWLLASILTLVMVFGMLPMMTMEVEASGDPTATFNANGGKFDDGTTTYTEAIDTWMNIPSNPTWDMHIFDGWYDNEDFTGEELYTSDITKLTVSTTLYAKWNKYTTDSNSLMAYTYVDTIFRKPQSVDTIDIKNFDIRGVFDDKWKQVTYFNRGFTTALQLDGETITVPNVNAVSSTGGGYDVGSTGLNVAIDLSLENGGQTIKVIYTVENTDSVAKTFSLASGGDIQIGVDDKAPITSFTDDTGFMMVSAEDVDKNSSGEYAQFNVFLKDAPGVTNVDGYWYGEYEQYNTNYFTDLATKIPLTVDGNGNKIDSGATWHWADETIGANETKTYSIKLGIGGPGSEDVVESATPIATFFPNNGTATTEVSITANMTIPTPTKTGYTFDGWYDNAEITGTALEEAAIKDLGTHTTLYAKWEVATYTVTFDPNNGGVTSDVDVAPEMAIPTPIWNNFHLAGWYDNAEFTGTALDETAIKALTTSKTLYAKWQASASDTRPVNKVGDFIVTGGTLGTDYEFSSGVLKIKTETPLTIENFDKDTQTRNIIFVNDATIANVNITLAGVNCFDDGFGVFRSKAPMNLTLADGTVNILSGGSFTDAIYMMPDYSNNSEVPALNIYGTGELRTSSIGSDSIDGHFSLADTLEFATSKTSMPDDNATYARGTGEAKQYDTTIPHTAFGQHIRIKPYTAPTPPSTGGSGGGSSSTNEPDVDVDEETGDVTAKPEVNTQTDEDGTTTAKPEQDTLAQAIDKASEEKKELEADGKDSTADVVLEVDTNSETKAVGIQLIVEDVDGMVAKDIDNLVITSDLGTVTLDQKALQAIADGKAADEAVVLIIREVEDTTSELTEEQKAIVGDAQVYELYIEVNGNRVSDFKGGKATVQVPDGLAEDVSEIKVYYVDDEGNIEYRPTIYDKVNRTITFVTEHFSHYLISTKTLEATLPFVDVEADDWFYDSVQFAYQNGLMSGTSDTTFAPFSGTTRGMIVTILHRLEGAPETEAVNQYEDVADGQYYSDAVAWGDANGIIFGYGNGNFGPDDTITREQLAAILYRYADFKAMDITTGEDTNILSYDDSFDMSTYAVPALQWAIAEGLITGRSESILAPTAGATRAEVSMVLMHFDALTK